MKGERQESCFGFGVQLGFDNDLFLEVSDTRSELFLDRFRFRLGCSITYNFYTLGFDTDLFLEVSDARSELFLDRRLRLVCPAPLNAPRVIGGQRKRTRRRMRVKRERERGEEKRGGREGGRE
eukprot:786129-Rhodomonas_salina.2